MRVPEPLPIVAQVMEEEPIVVEILPDEPAAPKAKKQAPTFEELWEKSLAVDEERTNLENLSVTLQDHDKIPFPELSSKLAKQVGEPIASLYGKPPLKGWRFATCGLMFIAGFTICAICGFLNAMLDPMDQHRIRPITGPLSYGGGGLILFCWTPFIRSAKNSLKANFWICENGVVWAKRTGVEALRFDQITEIYRDQDRKFVTRGDVRVLQSTPVVRMVLNGERVTFYATKNKETAEFVTHIEQKVSAAFLKKSLRRIYAGESVSFGTIDVNRNGIHFMNDVYEWSDLKAVELDESSYALVLVRKRRKDYLINANHITMARVVVAIAAIIKAEKLQLDENSVEKPKEKNLFAF
jgi:hypothetical protein